MTQRAAGDAIAIHMIRFYRVSEYSVGGPFPMSPRRYFEMLSLEVSA
jgi:hypothetical protein